MEDYKIRYNQLDKGYNVTEFMTKERARKKFNQLKNEKERKTVWAELVFVDSTDETKDEEIIDDFERKVIEILGHKMII